MAERPPVTFSSKVEILSASDFTTSKDDTDYLGCGGFAAVRLCRHSRLGRVVAKCFTVTGTKEVNALTTDAAKGTEATAEHSGTTKVEKEPIKTTSITTSTTGKPKPSRTTKTRRQPKTTIRTASPGITFTSSVISTSKTESIKPTIIATNGKSIPPQSRTLQTGRTRLTSTTTFQAAQTASAETSTSSTKQSEGTVPVTSHAGKQSLSTGETTGYENVPTTQAETGSTSIIVGVIVIVHILFGIVALIVYKSRTRTSTYSQQSPNFGLTDEPRVVIGPVMEMSTFYPTSHDQPAIRGDGSGQINASTSSTNQNPADLPSDEQEATCSNESEENCVPEMVDNPLYGEGNENESIVNPLYNSYLREQPSLSEPGPLNQSSTPEDLYAKVKK